jgi:hypothetical protein
VASSRRRCLRFDRGWHGVSCDRGWRDISCVIYCGRPAALRQLCTLSGEMHLLLFLAADVQSHRRRCKSAAETKRSSSSRAIPGGDEATDLRKWRRWKSLIMKQASDNTGYVKTLGCFVRWLRKLIGFLAT